MPSSTDSLPEWHQIVRAEPPWSWLDGKLWHADASSSEKPRQYSLAHRMVLRLYADHNDSKPVRDALGRVLSDLSPGDWGLNLGAGPTRVHPRIVNLDIANHESVDIVNSGLQLPFKDNSLQVVISQEVLEHLPEPDVSIAEAFRVLKPGGRFYCQTPFIIGYHPGPNDYWRFTKEGMQQLFSKQDWLVEDVGHAVGHGTGFYRIAVEFCAVTASALTKKAYLPTKAISATLLYPIKLSDRLSKHASEVDRIPGGYYCVARKS